MAVHYDDYRSPERSVYANRRASGYCGTVLSYRAGSILTLESLHGWFETARHDMIGIFSYKLTQEPSAQLASSRVLGVSLAFCFGHITSTMIMSCHRWCAHF